MIKLQSKDKKMCVILCIVLLRKSAPTSQKFTAYFNKGLSDVAYKIL